MSVDLNSYLRQQIELIDNSLDQYLKLDSTHPISLLDSMRYSIFAGGKRLRPILTITTCDAYGGNSEQALPVACAIEMIHTYSLIHDDLPAMDNDDYRRGKPTNHKVYGDAIAILAGDALLTKAFQVIAQSYLQQLESTVIIRLIEEIGIAAGAEGMVGGQVADIEAEGRDTTIEQLQYIHTHKTGALLTAAVRSGAIVAGVNEDQLDNITEFANKIGLAFQIQDDILDLIGDQDKIGKKTGSDLANDKATYPVLLGIEASKEKVMQLTDEALIALGRSNCNNPEYLIAIAKYLISRDR